MKHALFAGAAALSLVACALPATELDESHELTAETSEAIYTPPPVAGTLTFEPGRDGTVADSTYSSWGIALSAIDCFTIPGSCVPGHAYMRPPGEASASGVSLFRRGWLPHFNAKFGAVEATFSTPVSLASVRVLLTTYAADNAGPLSARPWLEGYDAAGKLVAKAFGTPTVNTWQTVAVTGPGGAVNITRVRFSVEQRLPELVGLFDNVTFDHSVPPPKGG
jgi:hypothetical protein